MKWMMITRRLVAALFFFSITLFAFSSSEMIFNSPDENANAFFALSIADSFSMSEPVSYDETWNVLVHPRSMRVIEDQIVPVSFTGFSVLAGLVASVAGHWSIIIVTPILSLLALMAWWKIIFVVFDRERLADLSAVFLMVHPAFWHYSGRVMMHNVAFVAMLIFALYFFVRRPLYGKWKKYGYIDELLAGVSFAFALAIRSSEAVWVVPIVVGLLIWKYRAITWKRIVIFACAALLTIVPFLFINAELYGAPWLTGYTAPFEQLELPDVAPESAVELEALPGVLGTLFPFGIHEMNIVRSVWAYGFLLYPWMSILSLLGIIFVFKKKEYRSWLIVTIGLGLWMAVVYGSWKFSDNPDASVITIANSYARYWLPLFVLGSLFTGVATDKIAEWAKKRSLPFASMSAWVISLFVILFSGHMVIWGTDGFLQTQKNLESFLEKKSIVLEQTPENAIIVVDMADKYLFPERSVVTPLRDEYVYAYIPEMMEVTDVFYLGITLPEQDIIHLEDVKFEGDDVDVIEVAHVGDETLYQFVKQQND